MLLPCVGGSPCVLTIRKLLKEIFLSLILHGGILITSLPYVEDSPWFLTIWKLLEEVFLSPILVFFLLLFLYKGGLYLAPVPTHKG